MIMQIIYKLLFKIFWNLGKFLFYEVDIDCDSCRNGKFYHNSLIDFYKFKFRKNKAWNKWVEDCMKKNKK